MAAGAAPEVPALGAFALALAFVCAWLACRALLAAYRNTLGYLLQTLGSVLHIDVWRVHVDVGKPLRALDHAIMNALVQGALGAEKAMGYFLHESAVLFEWGLREIVGMGREVYSWAEWLQHVHLPRWAKWIVAAAFPPLLIARLVRAAIAHELPHLRRLIHAGTKTIETTVTKRIPWPHLNELRWIHRHWKALTIAVLGAAALPLGAAAPWLHWRARLKEWDRDRLHIWRRLHRLEKLLGVSAFAGAMAAVLGLPNWRCLTRGNVGRTARAICGIPAHVLNDLLGLITDFLVIANICEVMVILNEGFALVEQPLADFVGAAGAALCHGDYEGAPEVTVRAVTLPPLQARSAAQAA